MNQMQKDPMKKLQMVVLVLACFLSVNTYSRAAFADLKKSLEPVQKGSEDCPPPPPPEPTEP